MKKISKLIALLHPVTTVQSLGLALDHIIPENIAKTDRSYVEESMINDNFLSDCGVSTSESDIKMQCASFALQLMSKHKLPETSVNDIIESTINFLVFSEEIHQTTEVKVSEALDDFKTRKTREAFFRKNCNYIPPQEVILGQSVVRKKRYVATC